jgi:glycosyltransferase involved in cell wall biosynthesis
VQLSAVVITFNEERNIARCLDSLVGVADEVVVVDSFSSDATEAICRARGARFVQHVFEGHIEQKNWALAQARHDWVLSLDADEALSGPLRDAILAVKNAPQHAGYTMNRLTNYCGQWIWHSNWYPDRKLRLFDRRRARWGGTNPHDFVQMDAGCSVAQLAGDLLHYSYYTENEHVERARRYADIAAKAMHAQGRRGSWGHVFFSPLLKFLKTYVLRRGFLDGRAGWVICRVAALETYWKYRNLMKLR